MLYVVVTSEAGNVSRLVPCDNGIDQAIEFIAGELSMPEEDDRIAFEIVCDTWAEAVAEAEMCEEDAHHCFLITRRTTRYRYGLAVV